MMTSETWKGASRSFALGSILYSILTGNIALSANETKEKRNMVEQQASEPEKPGWRLTFQDECSAPELDKTNWFDNYRDGLVRAYRKHNVEGAQNRPPSPTHYVIRDGILHLRIDKDLPARAHKHASTVTSVQTSQIVERPDGDGYMANSLFSQKYGWFEIRCRMPAGSGLHSAFWLLHADPYDQEFTLKGERRTIGDGVVEIDIFEQLGGDVENREIQFNVHFTEDGHHKHRLGSDPSHDFHVYALEWRERELIWYIDGKEVRRYKGETPAKEMFVLVGLYQGSGWTGEVDKNMPYPRDFEVDYVRVYSKQAEE